MRQLKEQINRRQSCLMLLTLALSNADIYYSNSIRRYCDFIMFLSTLLLWADSLQKRRRYKTGMNVLIFEFRLFSFHWILVLLMSLTYIICEIRFVLRVYCLQQAFFYPPFLQHCLECDFERKKINQSKTKRLMFTFMFICVPLWLLQLHSAYFWFFIVYIKFIRWIFVLRGTTMP